MKAELILAILKLAEDESVPVIQAIHDMFSSLGGMTDEEKVAAIHAANAGTKAKIDAEIGPA